MKTVRKIIEIDEERCDGCGQCVISCAEGALEIIDGKARLVSEVYCDGLGACLGECPQGALHVVERKAEAFDPEAVEAYLEQTRLEDRKGGIRSPGRSVFHEEIQIISYVHRWITTPVVAERLDPGLPNHILCEASQFLQPGLLVTHAAPPAGVRIVEAQSPSGT